MPCSSLFQRKVRTVRGRYDLWDSAPDRGKPQKSLLKTSERGVSFLCDGGERDVG